MQGSADDFSDDANAEDGLLGQRKKSMPAAPPAVKGGLQIIGAGLPRTGTNSLMTALHILGYNSAHMESMVRQGSTLTVPMYNLVIEGECVDGTGKKTSLPTLLTSLGYTAAVDYPWCAYYKEMAAECPDAKVILSVRGVDGWIKSFRGLEEQVAPLLRKVVWPLSKLFCWAAPQQFVAMVLTLHSRFPGSGLHYMSDPVNEILRGAPFKHDEDAMRAAYHAHNEDVKATIAPERLLEFDCRQGWEPLCAFLGKPVPDVPFPSTNSASSGGAAHTVLWKSFKETMIENLFCGGGSQQRLARGGQPIPNDGSWSALDMRWSAPIQQCTLPESVESFLHYPDGELGFGKDTVLRTTMFTLLVAQLVHGFSRGFMEATPLWAGGGVMSFALIMTVLLKDIVKRRRPEPLSVCAGARIPEAAGHRAVCGRDEKWLNSSFPSGCALCVTAWSVFMKNWTGDKIWLCFIPLAMFVRVYFVCHWLGDTMAGALIGFLCSLTIEISAGGDFHNIGPSSPSFYLPVVLLFLAVAGRKLKGKSGHKRSAPAEPASAA